MCREDCLISETHLVCTKKRSLEIQETENKPIKTIIDKSYNDYINNDLSSIKIAGNCNSAKVEGIVKCLIKIIRDDNSAKCIVFSEHVTMLELCQELLKDNYIDYKLIKDNNTFQKNIQEFKKNLRINVLLMPYTFGANGLNIIEATHVLLIEPTLNKSQELQAIGRVHRIVNYFAFYYINLF
jgi:SNF2 family DNA or RNA helicase